MKPQPFASASLIVAVSLFCLQCHGISQEDSPRLHEKSFRALVSQCDELKDPKLSLMLIREYRHRNPGAVSLKQQLDEIEAKWTERVDKNLVRLGAEWVSIEEKAKVDEEARRFVEEAYALFRLNDSDGARDALERASAVNKEQWLADYLIGLDFALGNSPAEAKKHFKKVIARSPLNVGALNNLAVCELKEGNGPSALSHWTKAAQIAPANPEIIHNLGRVIFEQGRDRLRISKGVFEKYRKLYGSMASTSNVHAGGALIWKLTPAVAAEEVRPQNEPENARANLVSMGGQGTGFFVAENHLLTNRHVIESDTYGTADAIEISIPSGDGKTPRYRAEVVAVSKEHDLAVLRCDGLSLPQLELCHEIPRLGEEVIALGYPHTSVLGFGIKSTRGGIAGIPQKAGDVLFYDVAINPGNSGGPLLNKHGQVVSINTFFMNVEQAISGGTTSVTALPFLERSIPGFKSADKVPAAREWADIAEAGARSTVLVEVLFRDAAPILAARAGAAKMSGAYYVDDACLICRGSGKTACTNKSCQGGKITIRSVERRVMNVGRFTKETDVAVFRRDDCPTCNNNKIACPACKGTGKSHE